MSKLLNNFGDLYLGRMSPDIEIQNYLIILVGVVVVERVCVFTVGVSFDAKASHVHGIPTDNSNLAPVRAHDRDVGVFLRVNGVSICVQQGKTKKSNTIGVFCCT